MLLAVPETANSHSEIILYHETITKSSLNFRSSLAIMERRGVLFHLSFRAVTGLTLDAYSVLLVWHLSKTYTC
jgi:hypothetical protein